MKLTKSRLREIIQEVLAEVEEDVDEATTTASIDGYMTPHAFTDTDEEEPDDDYVDDLNKSVGYKRVDEAVIQLNKKDYDKLQRDGKVIISRLSTGFRHKVDPQMYRRYPKNLDNIEVINPKTKKRETFPVGEVEHEDGGIYIHVLKEEQLNENDFNKGDMVYSSKFKSIGWIKNADYKNKLIVKFDNVGEKFVKSSDIKKLDESLSESRIDKKDAKRASQLQDVIKKYKAGKIRRDAVIELAKIAQKYSSRPIKTVKGALLTLDLIEPDAPNRRANEDVNEVKLPVDLKTGKEDNQYINRWLELKKSDKTPNQKIGIGVRNIRYELQEMNKFLSWYNRIRQENNLSKDKYWKRTQSHIEKMKENMISIIRQVQEIDRSLDDINQ